MIPNAECKGCVFWELQPEIITSIGRIGQCRRHAPAAVLVGGNMRTRWPLTPESGWCGDHAIVEADQ